MIILASKSSRRIELLKDAGLSFEVIPSNINEKADENLTPIENAMHLAELKATDVYTKYPNSLVIAADTIVTLNNKIYGKPKTEENAILMLKELRGKKHDVITGVAIIYQNKKEVFYSKSSVLIKDLTDEEIINYVQTKEPLDKAGAYAIQGIGKDIVETYEGDFLTIVGLPLKEVLTKIKEIKK